jgi:hypothetical protein
MKLVWASKDDGQAAAVKITNKIKRRRDHCDVLSKACVDFI